MNDFEIDGRTIQFLPFNNNGTALPYVEFYEGVDITYVKKYLFFGPEIRKEKPKLLFTIYQDFHDEHINKEMWERWIREGLKLNERKKEIKRGEII